MNDKIRSQLHKLFVNVVAASVLTPSSVRARIYRAFGIRTETTFLGPRCFFSGSRVHIGEGAFVNTGCFFENHGEITIGRNSSLGMEVMLCASTHEMGGPDKRAGTPVGKPIVIGDGVWIGTRATVLPGVRIGDGCVIAAGAVVTKDCAPHGIYAGTPARRVKELAGPAQAEFGQTEFVVPEPVVRGRKTS
ncbi:acyltransferase [Paenibacillus aurantius]|uniref:Acyltransferase n=1 Tax=Paenibacillus aurantius TaxID=2918900 RepID=A0AA96LCI8_9BACL|nr:acyltransferase [Paenibacillus aurantius]WNQ10815.1 acyltransferase [Paenibacillus aurantius]